MKLSVIAHTHWDREWYFSHFKSRVYALKDFDEIIETLEKNSDIGSFLLDGQTSIIEEYLEFHPHMKERLEKLIKDKRILTGPWYSQTDTLVISAENIVRNLLYGTSYAKKLGHSMKIGYLPDSFGMSEQMPQIYNGFDLKYTMFRRGIADSITKDREFFWSCLDGSKVFCHNIYHYGSMAYPPEDKEAIKKFVDEKVELLKDSSKTGNIVLFNGEDQKPIRRNIMEIIKTMEEVSGIKTELVSAEDVMDELYKSNVDFVNYQGEMTFGQHSRTHKSIFSTRYDMKKKNNELENFLTNVLEPALSIAHILGFDYEKRAVDYIWKKMLENAAHDSIGMCNSDITNKFINARFDEVKEFSENLLELKLREISGAIKEDNIYQFQVYNLLPYKREKIERTVLYIPSENIEIKDKEGNLYPFVINSLEDVTEKVFKLSERETGVSGNISPRWLKEAKRILKADISILLKDIPSLGYKTLFIEEITEKVKTSNSETKLVEDKNKIESTNIENGNLAIDNDILQISLKENKVVLTDKREGKVYEDFIRIEEDGDEGDSYDYSEPTHDLKCRDLIIEDAKVMEDDFYQTMEITGKIKVPSSLEKRSEKVSDVDMDVKLSLTISNEDKKDILKARVKILNKTSQHRVRLIINSTIESETSIADEQFGTIYRPVKIEVENWKENGWNEKPRTIEPMISFCALRNENNTVEVITEAVREYQIVGENFDEIAMTVFRSTEKLGRENLNDRPGRESGNKSDTFDTRYINEEVEADYYIKISNRKETDYLLSKEAKEILTPMPIYQGAEFKNNTEHLILSHNEDKNLNKDFSLLEVEGEVIFSTLKRREEDDSLIMRVFNPQRDKKSSVKIKKMDIDFEIFNSTLNEKQGEVIYGEREVNVNHADTFLIKKN